MVAQPVADLAHRPGASTPAPERSPADLDRRAVVTRSPDTDPL